MGGPVDTAGALAAVVTVTFNRAEYLERHVASLLDVHGRDRSNRRGPAHLAARFRAVVRFLVISLVSLFCCILVYSSGYRHVHQRGVPRTPCGLTDSCIWCMAATAATGTGRGLDKASAKSGWAMASTLLEVTQTAWAASASLAPPLQLRRVQRERLCSSCGSIMLCTHLADTCALPIPDTWLIPVRWHGPSCSSCHGMVQSCAEGHKRLQNHCRPVRAQEALPAVHLTGRGAAAQGHARCRTLAPCSGDLLTATTANDAALRDVQPSYPPACLTLLWPAK